MVIVYVKYTIYVKYVKYISDITQIKHYPENTFLLIVYSCMKNSVAVLAATFAGGWLFDPDSDTQLGGQPSCILFQSVNVPSSPLANGLHMGDYRVVTPLTVPDNIWIFLVFSLVSESYHEPSGFPTVSNPDACYERLCYPASFSGAAGESCP